MAYFTHVFPRRLAIAQKFVSLFDDDIPIQFSAYDGSRAGLLDTENTLEINSEIALRYILSHANDLGLARAYIMGHLEIRGNLYETLMATAVHLKKPAPIASLAKLAFAIGPRAVIRPELPTEEAPPRYRRGILHSLSRDKQAIAHHYDISNDFYSLILGPTMVYSCGIFASNGATLEQAQTEKMDLICRKLDLKPGRRLLDIGCGWGALVRHAAREYGVRAVGITLSQNQLEFARQRVAAEGLSAQVEIRLQDYRKVPDREFDAVSSVGMSEHVGESKLNLYFSQLATRIKDDGRILNHCITRPNALMRAKAEAFIDRYIFPDGELSGPSRVVAALHDSGLELRHSENIREHYTKTLEKWCGNLTDNWDAAVAEVGLRRARIWLLYMNLSRIGFATNQIQVHQFLGVANFANGQNTMSLRNNF